MLVCFPVSGRDVRAFHIGSNRVFIGLKVVHRFVSVSSGESEVGEEAGRVTDYCNVSVSRKQGLKNVGFSC